MPQMPETGFGFGNLEFEGRDYDWANYGRQIYWVILRAWYRRLWTDSGVFERWASENRQWVLDHKSRVRFTIDRGGKVVDIAVEGPSGCYPLDDSAREALQEVVLPPTAGRFPPFGRGRAREIHRGRGDSSHARPTAATPRRRLVLTGLRPALTPRGVGRYDAPVPPRISLCARNLFTTGTSKAGPSPARASVMLDDETLRDGLQSPSVRRPAHREEDRDPAPDGRARHPHGQHRPAGRRAARARRTSQRSGARDRRPRLPIEANCAARTVVGDIEPIVDDRAGDRRPDRGLRVHRLLPDPPVRGRVGRRLPRRSSPREAVALRRQATGCR